MISHVIFCLSVYSLFYFFSQIVAVPKHWIWAFVRRISTDRLRSIHQNPKLTPTERKTLTTLTKRRFLPKNRKNYQIGRSALPSVRNCVNLSANSIAVSQLTNSPTLRLSPVLPPAPPLVPLHPQHVYITWDLQRLHSVSQAQAGLLLLLQRLHVPVKIHAQIQIKHHFHLMAIQILMHTHLWHKV